MYPPNYLVVDRFVVLVSYRIAPLICGFLARNLDRNMTEPGSGRCAMPVFHVGRNQDKRAFLQMDGFFSFFLIPAFACGADQHLAAAGFCAMYMPEISAAGLEGYIGDEQGRLSGLYQRIQIRIPRKVLGEHGVFKSFAKRVGFVELFFVCKFHFDPSDGSSVFQMSFAMLNTAQAFGQPA